MVTILAIIKQDGIPGPILIDIDSDVEKFEDLYVEEINRLRRLIQQKFKNASILDLYLLDGIQRFRIEESLSEVG